MLWLEQTQGSLPNTISERNNVHTTAIQIFNMAILVIENLQNKTFLYVEQSAREGFIGYFYRDQGQLPRTLITASMSEMSYCIVGSSNARHLRPMVPQTEMSASTSPIFTSPSALMSSTQVITALANYDVPPTIRLVFADIPKTNVVVWVHCYVKIITPAPICTKIRLLK